MGFAGVPDRLCQEAVGIGCICIQARQLRGLAAVVGDGVDVPLEDPAARVPPGQRHHLADGIGEDAQHFCPFGARDVVAQCHLFRPRVAHPAAYRQGSGAKQTGMQYPPSRGKRHSARFVLSEPLSYSAVVGRGSSAIRGIAVAPSTPASRLSRVRPRVSGSSISITIMMPEATALNTAIVAPSGKTWLTNPTMVGKNEPMARPAL